MSLKEFISKTMVSMETEKMKFLSCHSHGCYEEKKLLQTLELYRPLQKLGWLDYPIKIAWDKMPQPQKCKCLEKENAS